MPATAVVLPRIARRVLRPFLPKRSASSVAQPKGGGTAQDGSFHVCRTVEPVEQNEPAPHGVHSPLLARPSVLLYEPSKHGKGADEPSAQNEPAMHVSHAVPPAPSW